MPPNDPPILPSLGGVIGAAKDRLIQVRPTAEPFVESGRYGDIITGWRGQFAVARRRLAEEVKAARLPFAQGEALTDLASSEYDTPRTSGRGRAIGEVVLTRTVVHAMRGDPVTTADATDGDTVTALLRAIRVGLVEHVTDVYRPLGGRGAHLAVDTTAIAEVSTADMGDLCDSAVYLESAALLHITGSQPGPHKDLDTLSTITAPNPMPSDPSGTFAANSLTARQRLLVLVNATKRALSGHMALEARAGTIRAGTKFRVEPNPTAVPAVLGSEYAVSFDFYAGAGTQSVEPTIEAVLEGAGSNLPLWAVGGPTLTVTATSPLFDASATLRFAATTLRAAGGSEGQTDEELRRAAAAGWTGVHGPTDDALVAGATRQRGVSRIFLVDDPEKGQVVIYPIDQNWAWSAAWAGSVERALRDGDWVGLGCKVTMGRVVNRVVRVELVVSLRDRGALINPSAITEALRSFVRSYFEARPDWFVFRLATMRAALSCAHRSIVSCADVRVLDEDGIPIAEPDALDPGADATHWHFADDALSVTYSGPG